MPSAVDTLAVDELWPRERNRAIKLRAKPLSWVALGLLVTATQFALGANPSPSNTAPPAVEVRTILTGEYGFAHPTGLAYLTMRHVLLVAAAGQGRTRLLRLDPFEHALGTFNLPTLNASALSFDPAGARLMALSGKKLITVPSGHLEGGKPPVRIVDIGSLGIRNPQGATFDPAKRIWLILDAESRSIVRVSASGRLRRSTISLELGDKGRLRGLAREPDRRAVVRCQPRQGPAVRGKTFGQGPKGLQHQGCRLAASPRSHIRPERRPHGPTGDSAPLCRRLR